MGTFKNLTILAALAGAPFCATGCKGKAGMQATKVEQARHVS